MTYRFIQGDSSNGGHPLIITEDESRTSTQLSTRPWATPVYTEFTPNQVGTVYINCGNHSYMGDYYNNNGNGISVVASSDLKELPVEEPVQETNVRHSGETVENNERVIYIDNDGDDSFTLAEVEYNKSQNLPYKIGFVASQEDAAVLTEEGINCIKHARDIIESMIVRTTGYI